MSEISIWIAGVGLTITILGALANLFFKMGQHSQRLSKVEVDALKVSVIDSLAIRLTSLELWKADVRKDMHEISDKMTELIREIHGVKTLIEERTERRKFDHPFDSPQSNWQEKRNK